MESSNRQLLRFFLISRQRAMRLLFEYTKNFDKADINADNIVVTEAEIEEAYSLVDP